MEFANLLQPFLEITLELLLPVVLGAAALWIRNQIAQGRAVIEERNLGWLIVLAQQFVVAAEQAGLTGQLEDIGEAKKAMVLALLQNAANARGVKVDVEVLSAIIEAAVVDAFGLSNSPSE